LDAWAGQQQESPQPQTLQLVLRQGNPLAALQSLGAWGQWLQGVQLQWPGGGVVWREPLDSWLRQHGFRPAAATVDHWQRDPLATLHLSLQDCQRRLAEQEELLSTQTVRLLLAQNRHEELTAERDIALAERDSLQNSLQQLSSERDQLQASCHDLSAQRDSLTAERDAQTARVGELEARIEKINLELDEILELIDNSADQEANESKGRVMAPDQP
jgi:hypothetical protein